MAPSSDKLLNSLTTLRALQDDGHVAIRSGQLSRTHRERLLVSGYIREVIKGWYIPSRPTDALGDTTAWYASFWDFCAAYLQYTKGNDWCLSPEASLELHSENWTVPKQLVVRSSKGGNNVVELLFGVSIIDVKGSLPPSREILTTRGIRIYSLPQALIACTPTMFRQNPIAIKSALMALRDGSLLLPLLIEGSHAAAAGRLAGALRHLGRVAIADDIVTRMKSQGFAIRETDPFGHKPAAVAAPSSPYVNRMQLMWQAMRQPVIAALPAPPRQRPSAERYVEAARQMSTSDAYHSLSIEGYRVTEELIERVKSGRWAPDATDKDEAAALAAKGYAEAQQGVFASIREIISGQPAAKIVRRDHEGWFGQLFAPGVKAGLHRAADFLGYRTGPVFIRGSRHVPPGREAVRSLMPALFEFLAAEPDPGVQAVLGHFFFVYIHPYPDGNGRTARFVMNAFLASGGHAWLIIPVQRRDDYFAALEAASVAGDIRPFAQFIAELMVATP